MINLPPLKFYIICLNDKFCNIVDIAEFLLLSIYREYTSLNSDLIPLSDDLCTIINKYLDAPLSTASYYDYHLSLNENILYYNELINQTATCRILMENRRTIAKKIDIIKNNYKRNKKYIVHMLSFLGIRVNLEYKNRTIISDIKINSIVISFLDDSTFVDDYDYYLYLLNIYYELCDDITGIMIR